MMSKKLFCLWALTLALPLASSSSASAEDGETLHRGTWTKGGYSIEGHWSIVVEEGQRFVLLAEDFETRKGPDLKIFLSPRPLSEIDNGNATSGSPRVALLERHSGSQRFPIPDEIDLARYRSIIIHCEKFSKYWGGASLTAASEPTD